MSYDLMVFSSSVAPQTRSDFMLWYKEQVRWQEAHNYMNHEITTPELKAWFLDIIEQYPPMNGPLAPKDMDFDELTEYSIGQQMIYCGFSWGHAEEAYRRVRELAVKHGVGFFDVSATNGDVVFANNP